MPTRPRAEPRIDTLIAELDPTPRAVAKKLRTLIRRTAPGLTECVKWNTPMWVGRKNVACLMLYDDHVNLGFFQGARLAATHPEVEGTGKSLRHVKVRTSADADRPVLKRLIREAIALDSE